MADSSRAWLLDEISERGFPTYFVPFEDVRGDALEKITGGRWTVVAAGRRAHLMRTSAAFGIAPVSPQLILCFIAEKVLGLPKSY